MNCYERQRTLEASGFELVRIDSELGEVWSDGHATVTLIRGVASGERAPDEERGQVRDQ